MRSLAYFILPICKYIRNQNLICHLTFYASSEFKNRAYKMHAFINKAMLCRVSASYFIYKLRVLLEQTKVEQRYPHFKSHTLSTI